MEARQGRVAFALATGSVGWGLLLIVAAFVFPAYSGESCGGGTGGPTSCMHETQTYVDVNGVHALLWLALPSALAGVGWLLLHARCSSGLPGAAGVAQLCAAALLVFSVFSFSILIIPMPVLLFAASVWTPQGTHSAPR